MELDWGKAPKWAMWHANDESGDGWWHTEKPYQGRVEWLRTGGKVGPSDFNTDGTDWQNSLVERPASIS